MNATSFPHPERKLRQSRLYIVSFLVLVCVAPIALAASDNLIALETTAGELRIQAVSEASRVNYENLVKLVQLGIYDWTYVDEVARGHHITFSSPLLQRIVALGADQRMGITPFPDENHEAGAFKRGDVALDAKRFVIRIYLGDAPDRDNFQLIGRVQEGWDFITLLEALPLDESSRTIHPVVVRSSSARERSEFEPGDRIPAPQSVEAFTELEEKYSNRISALRDYFAGVTCAPENKMGQVLVMVALGLFVLFSLAFLFFPKIQSRKYYLLATAVVGLVALATVFFFMLLLNIVQFSGLWPLLILSIVIVVGYQRSARTL